GSLSGMQIPTLNPAITAGAGTATITSSTGAAPIGFHTPNVNLVIASSGHFFGGQGFAAIYNLAGHNTWDKRIQAAVFGTANVGTALNTNLTFGLNPIQGGGITVGTLNKIGPGRLILPTANTINSVNVGTYS